MKTDELFKLGKQPLDGFAIGDLVCCTEQIANCFGHQFRVSGFEPGHRITCVKPDAPAGSPPCLRYTATRTKANPAWRVWLCKVS